MKPERRDSTLLAITRSKAKMFEYHIPEEDHIDLQQDPKLLLDLSLGILGDSTATGLTGEMSLDYTKNPLLFSAHYFDALQNTCLVPEFDNYLRLVASAAYNLCDIPGSGAVLARQVPQTVDLDARGLDRALRALLTDDLADFDPDRVVNDPYAPDLHDLTDSLQAFVSHGINPEYCLKVARRIRDAAYHGGSDRELLFADTIAALTAKRIDRSTWIRLPEFSRLPVEAWHPFLIRPDSIRELWPSQMLLGRYGVFSGRSAVIQMPTSAGKTKATEIVIRSAFLGNRARLCIIVAPFRALCHEIHQSLSRQMRPDGIEIDMVSDVLQMDIDLADRNHVIVLTPEKLDFLLRHEPELATRIGVLIFDEVQLLDDESRGAGFELLLTSLKLRVPNNIQKLLISAVARNAEDIRRWFLQDEGEVISSGQVLPTYRTVAFTSWLDERGRLEFVSPSDPNHSEFFVPHVITPIRLNLYRRERVEKFFPERDQPKDIALYLGCKLVRNGSVALFCGRKDTASWFAERITEVAERGGLRDDPSAVCDPQELMRLVYQHEVNLGANACATLAVARGIVLHHGNTPHGLRMAIEHAIERGHVSLVACTSTLAQGVNLPLRYLIVTGMHQGRERIRVRDFHNLMGRAGRAGRYTEGSVLFSNPAVFDTRNQRRESWRWQDAKELLDPGKSEPCRSALLRLLDPFHDRYSNPIIRVDILRFACACFESRHRIDDIIEEVIAARQGVPREVIEAQVRQREGVLKAIETFLLQYITVDDDAVLVDSMRALVSASLAYSQATENERTQLSELFVYIGGLIKARTPDGARRAAFSRTILSAQDCAELVECLTLIHDDLLAAGTSEALYESFWPFLRRYSTNATFTKCAEPQAKIAGLAWIRGASFADIFNTMQNTLIGRQRSTIDHAVDLAENGIGYEGSLIVGAARELLPFAGINEIVVFNRLEEFQKIVRYGLPTARSIALYEIGFVDRVLAQELAERLPGTGNLRRLIIRNRHAVQEVLNRFPNYFQRRFDELVG